MTRRLLALLAVLLSTGAYAESVLSPIGGTVPLMSGYNLTSNSYIFCYTTGKNSAVRGDWQPAVEKIVTSGSSTTTTSNTASAAALVGLAAGDEIMVYQSGKPVRRYLTAAASSDSVTVNSAWDLTGGYPYFFRHRTCSTTATAGWTKVSDLLSFSYEVKINTFNATAIDTVVQCRAEDADGTVNTAYTQHYTSTAADTYIFSQQIGAYADECRFGLKVTAATDVQAITVNLMTR